ncbi:MAG: PAC2 family protein [Dehalococcoidia bacterium]|nr:PAC2 family protein [Dehalococcoidia bacterium]
MPKKSNVIYSAHPELRQPHMIVALNGWVDGGESATGSLRFLRRKLRPLKLAEIPASHFQVCQMPGELSLRPYSRIEEGLLKEYRSQRNTFYFWVNPEGDRDVILFNGSEPNLNWEEYAAAILEVVREFGVARIYMLGGVLDRIPHTREPNVTCACTDLALRDELAEHGIEPLSYEGPGGIRTTLLYLSQKLHVEMAVLHARVTYYPEFNVVIARNPRAIRALVRRLVNLLSLNIDFDELDREVQEFERRITYMALQNHEFQAYIEAMEKEYSESETPDSSRAQAEDAIQAVEELLRGHLDDESLR